MAFPNSLCFFPVRKVSSQIVVDCLERSYFPIYGTPRSIVTDNASVFRSKQIRLLCFRWAVEHITTTPYYPQSSLVERVNRNLKSALKIFHSESQDRWDEDLPLLSVGFNTATHESSKFTPDVLFLGREINNPLLLAGIYPPKIRIRLGCRFSHFGPRRTLTSRQPVHVLLAGTMLIVARISINLVIWSCINATW